MEPGISNVEQLASLPATFFGAIDQHRYEDVAALMAKDGVWHRQGKVLAGRDAVLEAMRQRNTAMATAHLVTNLIIERSAGGATLTFHGVGLGYEGPKGRPYPIVGPAQIARYVADCVQEDGAWKIAKMSNEVLFKTETI